MCMHLWVSLCPWGFVAQVPATEETGIEGVDLIGCLSTGAVGFCIIHMYVQTHMCMCIYMLIYIYKNIHIHVDTYVFPTNRPSSSSARGGIRMRPLVLFV